MKISKIKFVESVRVPNEVAARVEQWFYKREFSGAILSENRGVLLPWSTRQWLKIKGSGHGGAGIQPIKQEINPPDRAYTGPPYCSFDFDGRRIIDHSMGHDNAPRGGMSFRQAVQEFEMSYVFKAFNYPAVPCFAWGKVDFEDQPPSWFTLHWWDTDLVRRTAPDADIFGIYRAELNRTIALHRNGVCGFHQVAKSKTTGHFVSYDLHPTRCVHIKNESSISMTCNLSWALTIARIWQEYTSGRNVSSELMMEAYRSFTRSDISPDEVLQFENWGTRIAGLTREGVTVDSSWTESYQDPIQAQRDIESNPISKAIRQFFANNGYV
jgi:hypothetical protein